MYFITFSSGVFQVFVQKMSKLPAERKKMFCEIKPVSVVKHMEI